MEAALTDETAEVEMKKPVTKKQMSPRLNFIRNFLSKKRDVLKLISRSENFDIELFRIRSKYGNFI
jgi:hypothetical protein